MTKKYIVEKAILKVFLRYKILDLNKRDTKKTFFCMSCKSCLILDNSKETIPNHRICCYCNNAILKGNIKLRLNKFLDDILYLQTRKVMTKERLYDLQNAIKHYITLKTFFKLFKNKD